MDEIILKIKNVSKDFYGIKALSNIDLSVKNKEIHALVGENGAGKSTLMNILSGTIPYGDYSGDVYYKGKECKFKKITDSEKAGIVIVRQELALIPGLSIAENLFLGHEIKKRFGIIDWDLSYKKAVKALERVGLKEDPSTLIKDIGVGKQQLVEIAKALDKKASLLILDEPTSSLNEHDSEMLLNLLKRLSNDGLTSIIISHKLPEVFSVADTITILRDGRSIESIDNKKHNIDENKVVSQMVGRELTEMYPKRDTKIINQRVFEVKNWNVYHPMYNDKKVVDNANLYVNNKEIVGLYGLQGAGRTELAMSLFGKSYGSKISGQEYINNQEVSLKNEEDAISHGLMYVTEDRKTYGLVLEKSTPFNISLSKIQKILSKFRIVDKEAENISANKFIKLMKIKIPDMEQPVETLSGGNQQKVLLSKALCADPKLLILDEPTRGIDVGAKYEIYCIINEMIESDKSILIISSELPELIGICDRIYIMHDSKIIKDFDTETVTQESIMNAIYEYDSNNTKDVI